MFKLFRKVRLISRRDYVPEEVYNRRWWILGVLCLSLVVVMIANTSLNVALPVLSRELSATNTQLQWMVESYSLVFAGLLFTAGAIGDRYGRKGIMQAGLLLFGVASAAAALFVDSADSLIAVRAAMGLAGAMVMPATLSILTNVFPPKERAKAVGLWAGVSGAGIALGPLLTGYLLEHFSWHSIFLINLPIILVTVLASAILVPRTADPSHTNLDLGGATLSAVGLVSLVYALTEAPEKGWLSAGTLAIGGIGLAIMALFVWWELRQDEKAMLDVRLFKVPAFGISSLALTLVFFALMGAFFSFSQLLQFVYGYGPLESAVRTLPMAFTMMFVSPLSTKLVEKLGKRRTVAAGLLLVAVGMFLISLLSSSSPYLALATAMVVMASGMATAMTPTTDLLMSAVPRSRAGMGSAMNDTTRELGGVLGIAILGSLLASQYSHKIAPAVASLPDATKEIAEKSLAGALAIAQQSGPAGEQIATAAKDTFIGGLGFSLTISAVIVALAGVIAYYGLPDNAADHVIDEIPEEGNFEVEEVTA